MTRQEAMRQTQMFDRIRSLGFTQDEAEQLRRISLTLGHWAERCCNEDIETREDGSAWVTWQSTTGPRTTRIPNREAGALRRLGAIMARHRGLTYYHQTDPRGAALYIVRKAEHKAYEQRAGKPVALDCCYSSIGLAVY